MKGFRADGLMELDADESLWDRFYTVAPLVVIGSKEPDGSFDLAPKHLAFPMGWSPYFGFVCAPHHQTYRNIVREGCFTVSYPRPDHVLLTGLTASPRCSNQAKPVLGSLPTFKALKVDGVLLEGGYLFLECMLHQVFDGFGRNSLITGRIEGVRVHPAACRVTGEDPADVLAKTPLLAFLYPDRFARLDQSLAFPFPRGFKR